MSIEVKNLRFRYGARPVIGDVSFTAEKGELLAVLGPNGVGKSTLFRCLLGFLKPVGGEILVDGKDCLLYTSTMSIRWRILSDPARPRRARR